MVKLSMIFTAALSTFLLSAATPPNVSAGHAATHVDWDAVGAAIGVTGSAQAAGVERFDLPRTDLKVKIGKIQLKPAFALGGYLVFLPMAGSTSAMMMGDLVVTESEIERVMPKLEQGGVDVTAIHNHLLWEKPAVKYMHVEAMGDAVHEAQVVHDALATTKTPLRTAAASAADQQVDLDTASLDKEIGAAGKVSGGTYKFSIAPKYAITSAGMTVPASMGTSTAFAFQPLGKGKAAITGDFALLGSQVNPVIRTLRANGIFVTALHSHMIDSQPTVFYMHFFATGGAAALARGLRAAVDSMPSG
jgi:hypothetical protein